MSAKLRPPNNLKEIEKRANVLNDDSISNVLRTECQQSRQQENFRCKQLCGSSISASIPEAHRIIMEFRNSLWVDPDSSALNANRTLLGKDHRIILLINELFKLQIE